LLLACAPLPEGQGAEGQQGYWLPKLEGNRARDIENDRRLRRLGWRVRTVWECELWRMAASELRARLRGFLV